MMNEWKKLIPQTIQAHNSAIEKLQSTGRETIVAAAEVVINTIKQNGTIYICGNGGSAADAQHIASEFVGRFQQERKPLPAVALTTDTSIITSLSNDYGYANVFAKQVEALVGSGDLLWAISTSGSSENIINAVRVAKQKGAAVLAFTGKADSELERMTDICFCASNDSTARSQEVHLLVYHIICDLVERNLFQ
jgi:D-sedoheptulose 7-phosphate isomerase